MLRTFMIGLLMLGSAAGPAPVAHHPRPPSAFSTEVSRAIIADPTVPETEKLPFVTDRTERMTVDVHIGQSGPFAFLIDTGSERTSISRQLAHRLSLAVGPSARVHSVLGSKLVETVRIPRLAVGMQALSITNAPIFEQANIGADGLLGLDSLRSQRVLFDFKAGEMHIVPSRRERVGVEDENNIIVRAKSRYGRLILTNATLDGIPLAVIIDTGAQLSIGNPALRQRLLRGRRIAQYDSTVEGRNLATITSVTGEVETVDLARIKRLDLGGVELRGAGIAFTGSRIFQRLGYEDKPALLLGIDAMRAFDRVAIDFGQRKVRFVLRSIGMIDRHRSAELRPTPHLP